MQTTPQATTQETILNPVSCESNYCPPNANISQAGNCRNGLQNGLESLEGLIWVGWDNLVNEPMGPVFDVSYKTCRMTPDDVYLMPDGMISLPVKKIYLDRSASFYESLDQYLQTTSQSINLDASISGATEYGVYDVSGSYSQTYQEVKRNFIEEDSSMFHTRLEYQAYNLPSQFGAKFHPVFMAQLLNIDEAIKNNLTRKAQYLSQLLIRNYGTHVITQAKVGAIIEQEDYVNSIFQKIVDSTLDEMRASASASFYGMFTGMASVSQAKSVNTTTVNQYNTIVRYSKVRTIGGPDVNQLLTATLTFHNDSQVNLLNLYIII